MSKNEITDTNTLPNFTFIELIDGVIKKASKNIFDDIFNSLSKISKVQKLCIINNLNKVQKQRINIEDRFQYNNQVIAFDDTTFNNNQSESQCILFDCKKDKEIAICDTKSIINLVIGGDIKQIADFLELKPNSKFIFFKVRKIFLKFQFQLSPEENKNK